MITKYERNLLYALARDLSEDRVGLYLHCMKCSATPLYQLKRIKEGEEVVGYECPKCKNIWMIKEV